MPTSVPVLCEAPTPHAPVSSATMRLATWNLNHRATRKKIPRGVADAIDALGLDAVVLTEFVPGPDRAEFIDRLGQIGLGHVLVSSAVVGAARRENHVLIASRTPVVAGTVVGPAIDASLPSNVLHAQVVGLGVDLLGVRVPDYSKTPSVRRACWDWLEGATSALLATPSVLLGDLNVDPSYPKSKCGDRLTALVTRGWTSATPLLGASYWTLTGKLPRRLDHGFVSEHLTVRDARYVERIGGLVFAGGSAALSDHAALLVEVGMA